MAEYLSGGRIQGSSTANPVTVYDQPTSTTNTALDVSSYTGDPSGLFVTADGTKIFMNSTSGTNNDSVVRFTLSTAWDLSTATQDQTYSVAVQSASPRALYFNDDGTKMFIVSRYAGSSGADNTLYQYTLSVGYDLTSTIAQTESFSLAATVGNSAGLKFNSDGTKFYVSHYGLWKVWQFSCTSGTPFDIASASFDTGKTFVPTDNSTEGFDFTFINNGLKIFMAEYDQPGGATGGASDGFVMTTAYDISTAAATGTTFNTNAVSNNPSGVMVSGAYLFQLDGNGQSIKRFALASSTTTTDEKTTITNVPVGTRYEETDTRKIYRRKAGGEAQANNVFNATNYTWATAGNSGNTITTGDDGTGQGVSSGSLSSYRRGKTTITSGNTKTFVWKFTWSRNSGDQANNSIFTLANFDWADSTPSGDEKNIKFQTSNTNVGFWRVQTASASVTSTQNSDFLQAAGTTRYYTVTGDGTNWKAQSWSDSARTTDEETTGDLGFPSDWLTTDPINNITFGSFGTADSNFTVKDISVKWDSGTAETWVEKGTA